MVVCGGSGGGVGGGPGGRGGDGDSGDGRGLALVWETTLGCRWEVSRTLLCLCKPGIVSEYPARSELIRDLLPVY